MISLSRPLSVAAAERGDEPRQEDEEDEETATPAFNVDKLRAETKTPFRTVGGAMRDVIFYCMLLWDIVFFMFQPLALRSYVVQSGSGCIGW